MSRILAQFEEAAPVQMATKGHGAGKKKRDGLQPGGTLGKGARNGFAIGDAGNKPADCLPDPLPYVWSM